MTRAAQIWAMMRIALAALAVAGATVGTAQAQEQATPGIESSEKSLMFAGRCMSQMFLGAPPDVTRLNQMPDDVAAGHLFGSAGAVYYGVDDRYVMIVHKPTNCGVNAFDETAEEMTAFFEFWLEREDSPFALTESSTDENGNVRISYDGHCTECGFDVHARGYWFKEEQFTIYRLYATKPEGAS